MTENDLRAEFVALRHGLGLSQVDAARELDRSAAWVRGIEQGRITCPRYAVLAMRWLSEHQATPTAP